MGEGAIILGVILIIFGIFLILVTNFHVAGLIYGIISVILGAALIIFWKEESKIEERKDLKSKKSK